MTWPTPAESGRFIAIVFGVLLIELLARAILFEGPREALGGGDIVIAITAGVLVMGGWLKAKGEPE
ncbi:hypothetical protein ACOYW6_01925 [Parablastomonas sp. CN1-191]|uniref:hypothetical protein n=1 Tax=Parablastomonas sp. CN1-191 TaxID=3400908 RepID=UPI003BF86F6A